MTKELPWALPNAEESQRAMMALAEELFPIHRTLVNRGYARSLEIIQRDLPVEVLEYSSGTQVYDWVIPNAWDVNEAYIEDTKGNRLVDFASNNLHLSAYSTAYDGIVDRDELLEHLKWIEQQPDAIPYNYLYYNRGWQFNIAYKDLARFTDDRYHVHIDVDERPGTLKIGSCYLPGRCATEILFSTYLCHPSLANDNLSGVIVAVELFKRLSQLQDRRYSYRLLIVPETIGAITWLAHHERAFGRILGAYVVYDCGNSGAMHYKKSFVGNALIDRVALHVLKYYADHGVVLDWLPYGSDERQYSAPGVRLPAGALTRTPPAEFAEYHTSKDTLDVLREESLMNSLQTIYRCVQIAERNIVYRNLYKGEPCLSRHQIRYPAPTENKDRDDVYLVKKVMHDIDGTKSLLDMAESWNAPFHKVETIADWFVEAGLICPTPDADPDNAANP